MPKTIAGPARPRTTRRAPVVEVEAEVDAIRAELRRHAWSTAEVVHRPGKGRPVHLIRLRWSETAVRIAIDGPDQLGAWRAARDRAASYGLLGPESRGPGRRPPRRRGPRIFNFTDLGGAADGW